MQVTVQLHVVQTWDAAVRLVLAVHCAGQGGDGRGEGFEEAEAQRLYIGSSLSREWGQWVHDGRGGGGRTLSFQVCWGSQNKAKIKLTYMSFTHALADFYALYIACISDFCSQTYTVIVRDLLNQNMPKTQF